MAWAGNGRVERFSTRVWIRRNFPVAVKIGAVYVLNGIAAVVALGAVLCVTPFLLEYRTAMKLTEADRLARRQTDHLLEPGIRPAEEAERFLVRTHGLRVLDGPARPRAAHRDW